MNHINLLPWRQERRKEMQQTFLAMVVGCAVLGAGLVFSGNMYVQNRVDYQNLRNRTISDEIRTLDRQIAEIQTLNQRRDALISRRDVLQELQASRSQTVHLFDELVRTLPDGIVLESFRQSGDQLTLTGDAESQARVANYLRSVESSEWFDSSNLVRTLLDDGANRGEQVDFGVRARLLNPNLALLKGEAGEGGSEQ